MIEGMPLTQLQLHFFLDALAIHYHIDEDAWKCGSPEFPYAREILTLMKIPLADQDKILEICREKDGHYDCEILMNAARFLLGEEMN